MRSHRVEVDRVVDLVVSTKKSECEEPVILTYPAKEKRLVIAHILTLAFLATSDGIADFALAPYSADVVMHWGETDRNRVGYFTALMFASRFFTMTVSCSLWTWFSGYVGRRPVILASQFLNSILDLLLGFSSNIYYFVTIRLISGAVSGIFSVSKVNLGENRRIPLMYQDMAFAVMPVMYILFGIITPGVSGLLALAGRSDVMSAPVFASDEMKWLQPFLLLFPTFWPNLFAFFVNIVGWVLALFFVQETNHELMALPGVLTTEEAETYEHLIEVCESINHRERHKKMSEKKEREKKERLKRKRNGKEEEKTSSLNRMFAGICGCIANGCFSCCISEEQKAANGIGDRICEDHFMMQQEAEKSLGMCGSCKDAGVCALPPIATIIMNFGMLAGGPLLMTTLPVLWTLDRSSGGIEFNTFQCGIVLLVFALVSMVVGGVVGLALQCVKLVWLLRLFPFGIALLAPFFPEISRVPEGAWTWVVVMIAVSVLAVMFSTVMTATLLVENNSVPLNGKGMFVAIMTPFGRLAESAGPFIGNMLLAVGASVGHFPLDCHLCLIVGSAFFVLIGALGWALPVSVSDPIEEEYTHILSPTPETPDSDKNHSR